MRIISVSCNGADIKFDKSFMKEIPVGGKIELPFSGDFPKTSGVKAQVTVNYVQLGAVTPFGSRTFDFTVTNGERVNFDSESPIVNTDLSQDRLLEKIVEFIPSLGLQKLVCMVYNTVKALLINIF